MRQSLMRLFPILGTALAMLATAVGAKADNRPPVPREPPSCLAEIAKAEHRHSIPPGLLVAISLVESGRHDALTGFTTPWPWTINANGSGRFYDSPEEAMKDAGQILAGNNAFVDVGCLQVDLYHHPHAFRTLSAAFDPETNVDYAANYLVALRRQHGSWPAAAAAYHAGNPADGGAYVARVLYYWRDLGTTADKAVPVPNNPRRRGFAIEDGPRPMDIAAQFYVHKDYAAALAIYRTTLAARPDDQIALLGTAECLRQIGRGEDARLYFERALAVDPQNGFVLEGLLRLIEAGPPERKIPHLLSARQIAPSSPEIVAALAMSEVNGGRLQDALSDMGAAVRLAPDDALLALNYALLLDRAADPLAAAAYERFLRLYRPDGVALTVSLQAIKSRLAYLQDIVSRP